MPEVTVGSSLSVVRGLIHLIDDARSLILMILLISGTEEVVLRVASQGTDRRVVELGAVYRVLVAVVVSAVERIHG